MGYGFAGMRRSSVPHTARRHTQVPPYIPGRTTDMVRRAGPMCPAAGMYRKSHNRLVCSDHVGRRLAPRRWFATSVPNRPASKTARVSFFFLSFCYSFFIFIYLLLLDRGFAGSGTVDSPDSITGFAGTLLLFPRGPHGIPQVYQQVIHRNSTGYPRSSPQAQPGKFGAAY